MALNSLVVHGVLPDRVMAGWHPTADEDFPTPHTDDWSCSRITSSMDLVFQFIPFFVN